ncbi:putative F-box domain, leucine-rich repeat domain superfamily, F-box-like domain superfamily [Helianthus annuus]|nr:putative F-box domain, leucine-rich repeat domain superfamily, F-box-like domain superfamily [Helianthus annuus]KAJ0882751.1 putative F-box domain, leucine-rich repeat domain superfamily, F-box-like domain superfamily [Helianthus annuus]
MRMDDRLSFLPDDVIIEILSFVGIKDAIGTSVLSSRWRFLWTLIPHLTFSTQDFSTMDNFFHFVTHVMSRRNNQLQLSSFNLCFRRKDDGGVAQRIMNHAFSLNVQQLNVTCLFGKDYTCDSDKKTGFPLSLSDIPMFRHLHPILRGRSGYIYTLPTPTHEFSTLATLHLCTVTLYDGFLSMCPNLENLTLYWCTMLGSKVFRICHPRLSNLTLTTRGTIGLVVHVVTPKLKYLTISEQMNGIQISAPELVFLRFEGPCPCMFTTGDFPSLEKAHLSMHNSLNRSSSYAPTVISLLQKFHNVKLLSLSMDIIELLNASVGLISHQPFSLANLKSLKILPCWGWKDKKVIMSAQVKNYLLNSSHNPTLTEVLPG